jgi:hypothetical protein
MSGPGIARRIAINEGTPRPRATGEREESVISAPGSRWSTTEHPIECCSGGWGSDGPEAASGALSDRSAGDRSVIPRAFLVRANPRPKRQNRSALDITPLNGRSPARAVASTKRSRSCPDLAELSAFHLLNVVWNPRQPTARASSRSRCGSAAHPAPQQSTATAVLTNALSTSFRRAPLASTRLFPLRGAGPDFASRGCRSMSGPPSASCGLSLVAVATVRGFQRRRRRVACVRPRAPRRCP